MDRTGCMGQNWRNWLRDEDEILWQNTPRVIWHKHARLPFDKDHVKQTGGYHHLYARIVGPKRLKLNMQLIANYDRHEREGHAGGVITQYWDE